MDLQIGKLYAGVDPADAGVVPAGNFTQVDIGHQFAGQFQFFHARQVVGHYHGAHAGRDVDHAVGHRGHFRIGQVGVAAGEIDDPVFQAADAAAASDTAVGDFRRNAVAIGLECKIIVRQRERCARAGQFFPAAPFRRLSAGGQNGGQCDENQFFHFSKF